MNIVYTTEYITHKQIEFDKSISIVKLEKSLLYPSLSYKKTFILANYLDMLFRKTGKLQFLMNMAVAVCMLNRMAISSDDSNSNNESSSGSKGNLSFNFTKMNFSTLSIESLGDMESSEYESVSQDEIDQFACNTHLDVFLKTYFKSNPVSVTRRFKYYYNPDFKQKKENLILIKNLIENSQKPSKSLLTKPIQVRRKDFLYKLPISNFVIPFPKEAVDIFIVNPNTPENEELISETAAKNRIAWDKNAENLSNLIYSIESIIYILLNSFYKKYPGAEIINRMVLNLLNKNKECYRRNTNTKISNIPVFKISYLANPSKALNILIKIISKEEEIIQKTARSKWENRALSKKIKEIEEQNSTIISQLENSIYGHETRISLTNFVESSGNSCILYMIMSMITVEEDEFSNKSMFICDITSEMNSFVCSEIKKFKKDHLQGASSSENTLHEITNELASTIAQGLSKIINSYSVNNYSNNKYNIKIKRECNFSNTKLEKLAELIIYFLGEKELNDLNKYLDDCEEAAIDNLKKIDFAASLEDLRRFPEGFLSNLADKIEKVIAVDRYGEIDVDQEELTMNMLTIIYAEYITKLKPHISAIKPVKEEPEIWDSPAFLHYNVPENKDVCDYPFYVIYKNSKNSKLYKKEVKNSKKNLIKFTEAKTHKDIECLEGKESKPISMNELLEIELNEIGVQRKGVSVLLSYVFPI